MCVSRMLVLIIMTIMIHTISGCTTKGSPAPDAVHQIEDGGSAVYDEWSRSLTKMDWTRFRMNPTCRRRSFRRNRIKGVRIEKSNAR